jgi:hypothetical protein
MALRSGKERALAPSSNLPLRLSRRTTPNVPGSSISRDNLDPIARDDSATSVTSRRSNEALAIAGLVALRDVEHGVENSGVGLGELALAQPAHPQHDLALLNVDAININSVALDNVPGPSTRPVRSVRATPKARGRAFAGELMNEMDLEERRPPSPKKKPYSVASTVDVINRLQRTQNKAKSRARINEIASEIVAEASRERPAVTLARAIPLQPPHAFEYCGTAAVFVDKEKDPTKSRIVKDFFAFKYLDWVEEAVDAMSGFLAAEPFEAQQRPAIASFAAHQKGFKSNPVTIEGESDWEDVIIMLKRWKESGCWSVNIDLKLRFSRVAKTTADTNPTHEIIKIDSDDETSYLPARKTAVEATTPGQSDRLKKAISKVSVTQKRLDQEAMYAEMDELAKSFVRQICDANHCSREICTRNAFPCVDFDGIHIKVTQDQLAQWSKKVEKRQATLKRPHDALYENLKTQADRKREKPQAKTTKNASSRTRRSSDDRSSSSDGARRGRKRSRHNTRRDEVDFMLPMLFQAALHGQSTIAHGGHSRQQVNTGSSPIRIPMEANLSVLGYMQYCADRDPARGDGWLTAGRLLQKEELTFEQLSTLSESELRSIGIPLGIAKNLTSKMKQYIQRQKRKRDNSDDEDEYDEAGPA